MAVKRISSIEANELLKSQGYAYLDVRSVPEFDQGHPTGAFNAPLLHMGAGGMSPNPEFAAVVGKAFPQDAKLVIGCKAGGRSQRAAMMLEAAGFTALVEMKGGWGGEPGADVGWAANNLPAELATAAGHGWEDLKKK